MCLATSEMDREMKGITKGIFILKIALMREVRGTIIYIEEKVVTGLL